MKDYDPPCAFDGLLPLVFGSDRSCLHDEGAHLLARHGDDGIDLA